MTYREILKLYKEGRLDEDKCEEVKQEIEKQDAISEYLFENPIDDVWAVDDIGADEQKNKDMDSSVDGLTGQDSKEDRAVDFAGEIQKSIRKAFLKMGMIITVLVLSIVAFCTLALPHIVNGFYYNPGKTAAGNTNQMSLDLEVYTELFMPFSRRNIVNVKGNGFGNYDIYIPETVSFSGNFHHVAGNLKRNQLTLYDANVFRKMTGNAFDWFQVEGDLSRPLDQLIKEQEERLGVSGNAMHGFAGGPDGTKETLRKLTEGQLYKAFFTLNQMMDYEDFIKLIQTDDTMGEIWCAVRTNGSPEAGASSKFIEDNIGFAATMSSSQNMDWDKEKYPELVLWNINDNQTGYENSDSTDEELMKTHFTSMLRYMSEQKQFLKMMEDELYDYDQAIEFVQKNGLIIYGFTAIADKGQLEKWAQNEAVYSIAIEKYE